MCYHLHLHLVKWTLLSLGYFYLCISKRTYLREIALLSIGTSLFRLSSADSLHCISASQAALGRQKTSRQGPPGILDAFLN